MGDKKASGQEKQVGQIAEQMADRVKESANQIWLAGLGAYSKAEEEGGKLVEALVQVVTTALYASSVAGAMAMIDEQATGLDARCVGVRVGVHAHAHAHAHKHKRA